MKNGKTNFAAFSKRTEFVFVESIELISVEEVSNFQMQTANLCESSAFSAYLPPLLHLIYLLSFNGAPNRTYKNNKIYIFYMHTLMEPLLNFGTLTMY